MFAVSLEALSVPSTITLPLKVSVTNELKSDASASLAVAVTAAVYTLVPALFALLSVTVILSLGCILLSGAAAITKAAIAFAFASFKVPVQLVTLAALKPEVVDSSKLNTPPPRLPAAPAAPPGPGGPAAPSSPSEPSAPSVTLLIVTELV